VVRKRRFPLPVGGAVPPKPILLWYGKYTKIRCLDGLDRTDLDRENKTALCVSKRSLKDVGFLQF
jgi:hypothetical protein